MKDKLLFHSLQKDVSIKNKYKVIVLLSVSLVPKFNYKYNYEDLDFKYLLGFYC